MKRMIESPNACDRVEVEKPCHKPRSSKLVFIDMRLLSDWILKVFHATQLI